MEVTGTIASLDIDFKTNKPKLTLLINEKQSVINSYDKLKSVNLDIKINQHRNKRSLDANKYCWALITKIAEKITSSKNEIYLDMLKKYGQGSIVKIPNKDLETFKRAFKYNQEHEKLRDESCTYMRFWVGSSDYNTYEMSKFIDGIISDCKDLEIETLTPMELEKIKKDWSKTYEKRFA